MSRVLTFFAATAALTIAITTLLTQRSGSGAAIAAEAFVPSCPRATYGADGNMGPLFCVIANPAALQHFAPMAKRTFALGRNAAPGQVTSALVADYKQGGTYPIICSVYRLAAWKNQWHFGVLIAAQVGSEIHAPSGWCSAPAFPGVEYPPLLRLTR